MTGFSVLPTDESNVDIDLINLIAEKGFKFFLEYYDKLPDDPESLDVVYFTRYLRMYLFEENSIFELEDKEDNTLFGNKWNDIVHLISREHYETLYLIIKHLDYQEQISFLEMFLNAMIYSVDIICLNSLIKNKDILELVASTGKIKEIIKFYAVKKELHDIIFALISNKKTRPILYKVLNSIAIENIHTNMINALSEEERIDIVSIKQRLVNISEVLMNIYFNGVKTHKISKFKLVETESTSYTPLNNMFSLIHKYLNLGFISITSYLDSFDKIIAHWAKTEEEHKESGDTYNAAMAEVQKKYFIRLRQKMHEMRSEELIRNVHRFYASDTLYWLNSLETIERQDITDEIINNYINYSYGIGLEKEIEGISDKVLVFYGDIDYTKFCDLALKIIDMKNKITSNISIKGAFLDTLYRRKGIGTIIRLDNYLVENLIKLFNCMASREEYYEYSLDCFTIFKILAEDINFEIYVSQTGRNSETGEGEEDTFDEFCHKILDTFHSCYTRMFEMLRNMNARQNGDGDGNEPETIDFTKDSNALACSYMGANIIILYRIISLVIKYKLKAFLGIASKDKFVVCILDIINELLGDKRVELKVEGFTNFVPINYLYQIYTLFMDVYPIQEFRKSVVNESRYLNFNLLFKMPRLLYKKNKILERECYQFIAIIEELKKYHELENELDLDDIPDEFLDPIMGTLINDPVMLPNSDTIMERDIIFRHVIAEKNNPFNREELSIKDIENFNSLDEIKEKICEFNRKKSETLNGLR